MREKPASEMTERDIDRLCERFAREITEWEVREIRRTRS